MTGLFLHNKILKKEILFFTTFFILLTIIGTLTHELGHITFAKFTGYKNTKLHYDSMYCNNLPLQEEIIKIYKKNKYFIDNNLDFLNKEEYLKKGQQLKLKNLLVTIGGPLQTISTGILGLLILYLRRHKNKLKFNLIDWIGVFLSLFWLREIFNLTVSISSKLFFNGKNYFGGDELYISRRLHISDGSVPISLGLIGLLISFYVVFKIVPEKYRFSFIISGIIGGIIGYFIWFHFLGLLVLP